MLKWLTSLFGRDTPVAPGVEAKFAQSISDNISKLVHAQFEMADVNPHGIRGEAFVFTCGYIAGLSDVMVQASGRKGGTSLSMTICLRTMQRLYGSETGEAMFNLADSSMKARSTPFLSGMNAGGEDASILLKQGWAMKLATYLTKRSTSE